MAQVQSLVGELRFRKLGSTVKKKKKKIGSSQLFNKICVSEKIISQSGFCRTSEHLSLGFFVCNNAAAAAKSIQSCLTLCDPRDVSPPGSPVPGILQARTLEWVAISFSNA